MKITPPPRSRPRSIHLTSMTLAVFRIAPSQPKCVHAIAAANLVNLSTNCYFWLWACRGGLALAYPELDCFISVPEHLTTQHHACMHVHVSLILAPMPLYLAVVLTLLRLLFSTDIVRLVRDGLCNPLYVSKCVGVSVCGDIFLSSRSIFPHIHTGCFFIQ